MLIRTAPRASQRDLVEFLLRLGCTVTRVDEHTLDVRVTYPQTVEDERGSLEEWCRAWVESPLARDRALEIVPAA